MKRLILLAIFALSFASVKAQNFYYGPTVGLNVSTLTKQSYSKAAFRGNIGVQVGYDLTNIISLHAEALYSGQGTRYNDSDLKVNLNYLKIPVLGRIAIIENLRAEAGISFNFLMKTNIKNLVVKDDADQAVDVKASEQSKNFDLSIPVGLSYLFFDKLELGIRYDLAMCRVWQDAVNKSRNSNFTIALRYRL